MAAKKNSKHHTCIYCHKAITKPDDIDNGEVLVSTRKYAHRQCFQVFLAGTATKKKEHQAIAAQKKKNAPKTITVQATKKGKTEAEYQAEKHFIEEVKKILRTDIAPVETLVIAKNYEEKYKITQENFLMALRYFYVIKGNQPSEHPFGIIPYVVNEAVKFYAHLEQTRELNRKADITQMYKKRTVYIDTAVDNDIPEIDITQFGNK